MNVRVGDLSQLITHMRYIKIYSFNSTNSRLSPVLLAKFTSFVLSPLLNHYHSSSTIQYFVNTSPPFPQKVYPFQSLS